MAMVKQRGLYPRSVASGSLTVLLVVLAAGLQQLMTKPPGTPKRAADDAAVAEEPASAAHSSDGLTHDEVLQVAEKPRSAPPSEGRMLRLLKRVATPTMVALVGALGYGILWGLCQGYVGRLGLAPEDLGVTQGSLLIRGAVAAVVISVTAVAFVLLLAGFLVGSLVLLSMIVVIGLLVVALFRLIRCAVRGTVPEWTARYRKVVLRSYSLWRRPSTLIPLRVRTGLRTAAPYVRQLLVGTAAAVMPLLMFWAIGLKTVQDPFVWVVFGVPALLIFVWLAGRSVLTVAVIASVFAVVGAIQGAVEVGSDAAESVIAGREGTVSQWVMLQATGLPMDETEVALPSSEPSRLVPRHLVFLGSNEGILVFTDRKQVIRVSGQGLAVSAPIPRPRG